MTLTDGLALLGFLGFSLLVATSGVIFKPGSWYRGLRKPTWTPPNKAFPIVWSVLYVLIAISGWLVWRADGFWSGAAILFVSQMVLNFLWSALFFGLRRPAAAFADILALAVLVGWTAAVFSQIDVVAGLLFLPYLAWVFVAAALNWSVWQLNRNSGVFA
ncbi:TspO/MBR family protein [Aureimonas sp. ME7]|uniref:TspO/MBR family protein n=1 Tax=Aureimonas sp. ME7 TaxID=2744252 RepID=UPI0015FE2C9D|nr:TspO/MBR family protein [Aureimonas sp. ME7]